jgi:hypothetical protein
MNPNSFFVIIFVVGYFSLPNPNYKAKDKTPIDNRLAYDFTYIMRKDSKREIKLRDGTFQLSKHDSGNYNSDGELVGTNRSIAAKTYEHYMKKKATLKRMKELSFEDAFYMYERMYIEIMQGEKFLVHNPLLLDMIFNAICSSAGTIHFKQVLYKCGCMPSKEFNITSKEVECFNRNISISYEKEKKFYETFWKIRESYYIQKSKKPQHKGLLKWIKDYPKDEYVRI